MKAVAASLFLFVLLLSATHAKAEPEKSRATLAEEARDNAMKAYQGWLSCMAIDAKRLAKATGETPEAIAVAAKVSCVEWDSVVELTSVQWFYLSRYQMPLDMAKDYTERHPGIAYDYIRAEITKKVVALVVETRAHH